MPEGWCWVKMEDYVFGVTDGDHQPPPQANEGVPFLVISDVNTGKICFDKSRFVEESYFFSLPDNRKASKGDLLFTVTGSYGIVIPVETEQEFCFQRHIGLIKVIADSSWLKYVLMSKYVQAYCDKVATGTAQKTVGLAMLRELQIPIPPLSEQQRIISVIEQCMLLVDDVRSSTIKLKDRIVKAKSRILDLAIHGKLVPQDANDEPVSELLKRINPKAVASCDNPHYAEPYDLPNGWTWCKLIDICTFLSRGKSPKYSETDTTYPVFAQKCNLKEGGISLEKAQFLEPTTLNRWPDVYHLQTGDVLVNSTGTGTVGRTRLFNKSCLGNYPFVVPDSHVSVIRTHGEIVSEYIFALMSSSWIQTYLEDNLAGSTNQKELYIGVLQNVDVPLPPVMEQTRIADKIESLYQQLDNIANHIE